MVFYYSIGQIMKCMQCTCVAVWPWGLSHGALHPVGHHHGWQAGHKHHSRDAFSVSVSV
jgi:hypothetical protein